MKKIFNLRIVVILYSTFMIFQSTIVSSASIHAQESFADPLQDGVSQLSTANYNLTQKMERGNLAMGFDQTKIAHEFSSDKDRGKIKITALDENDNRTISQIKNHAKDIQNDFSQENFTKPFYIHAQSVPGVEDMTQNKDKIQYQIQDLQNGSILLLVTSNSSVANSINQFMTYQSIEHKGH